MRAQGPHHEHENLSPPFQGCVITKNLPDSIWPTSISLNNNKVTPNPYRGSVHPLKLPLTSGWFRDESVFNVVNGRARFHRSAIIVFISDQLAIFMAVYLWGDGERFASFREGSTVRKRLPIQVMLLTFSENPSHFH